MCQSRAPLLADGMACGTSANCGRALLPATREDQSAENGSGGKGDEKLTRICKRHEARATVGDFQRTGRICSDASTPPAAFTLPVGVGTVFPTPEPSTESVCHPGYRHDDLPVGLNRFAEHRLHSCG